MTHFILIFALLYWSAVKDFACNVEEMQETQVRFWIRQISWRTAWPLSPVFLPGESHGPEPSGLQSTGSQRVRIRLKQLSTGLANLHQTCKQSQIYLGRFLKSVKNSKAFVSDVCLNKMKGYCLRNSKIGHSYVYHPSLRNRLLPAP